MEFNWYTVSDTSDGDMFHMAAVTPVPVSPAIERRFYESQLLLYVLENVRGDHSKRQNYHGELDQDATELRRSFMDQLAYICDFKRGGSTVTALALQQTPQGVTFWLAANDTVKQRVMYFLQEILTVLKNMKDGVTKESIEAQLLNRIISFNKERLDYYWSALEDQMNLCTERLNVLEGSTSKLLSEFIILRCTSSAAMCTDSQQYPYYLHPQSLKPIESFIAGPAT